ncbi:hypothetical protein CEXT_693841 [Caerostris extrusa]|uniref:Uncharacterized protein n=1 Tax=Caerostris extrusa TaxID=172846 RepID=A0AAV4SHG0_CAEEX|nr:hypothetical protein CEXT_693841 [Caerostris extrusa]
MSFPTGVLASGLISFARHLMEGVTPDFVTMVSSLLDSLLVNASLYDGVIEEYLYKGTVIEYMMTSDCLKSHGQRTIDEIVQKKSHESILCDVFTPNTGGNTVCI